MRCEEGNKFLPWVESDGDQVSILDMNATKDEVESGFGSAV
jgi:hypothetical protein